MKILVVYYSLYGHTIQLAKAVKEGAESVGGTEVLFHQVRRRGLQLEVGDEVKLLPKAD
jgi:multimeric flavodoxin WrbA